MTSCLIVSSNPFIFALSGLKLMTSSYFSCNGGIWWSLVAYYFYRKYFTSISQLHKIKLTHLKQLKWHLRRKNTKILSRFGTMPLASDALKIPCILYRINTSQVFVYITIICNTSQAKWTCNCNLSQNHFKGLMIAVEFLYLH